jgi:hypothetical protein
MEVTAVEVVISFWYELISCAGVLDVYVHAHPME